MGELAWWQRPIFVALFPFVFLIAGAVHWLDSRHERALVSNPPKGAGESGGA